MSLNDEERYRQIDLPHYRSEIAPHLPAQLLDFHAHTWLSSCWESTPWEAHAIRGGSYMATEKDYGVERLLADGQRIFPDRPYKAVCFGYATPVADLASTNRYTRQAGVEPGLFPLAVVGRRTASRSAIEHAILTEGFFGYKVLLNWVGDDYGDITIQQMIGPAEMALANEHRLIVLLHVPRAGRLVDPTVQAGVRWLSHEYPQAQIVLAHCGRCYLPDEMRAAAPAITGLDNVYLDTAMVMDPLVLEILFDAIPSRRVLFGTDFPVAAMRGRRVYVMDHWVDVVLEGYPSSSYRVASDGVRATFMAYEIVLAIRRAAEQVGLRDSELKAIFHDNGMALLQNVRAGQQFRARSAPLGTPLA